MKSTMSIVQQTGKDKDEQSESESVMVEDATLKLDIYTETNCNRADLLNVNWATHLLDALRRIDDYLQIHLRGFLTRRLKAFIAKDEACEDSLAQLIFECPI